MVRSKLGYTVTVFAASGDAAMGVFSAVADWTIGLNGSGAE
jgi:hypothetical protein